MEDETEAEESGPEREGARNKADSGKEPVQSLGRKCALCAYGFVFLGNFNL